MATDTFTRPRPVEPGHAPVSFAEILQHMSAAERLRAYRSGAFTTHERSLWAARYPEDVPLVNGEFEWIALTLADLD